MDYNPPIDASYKTGTCEQTGDTGWQWKEGDSGTYAISYRSQAYTTWSSLKEEIKIYAYEYSNGWSNQDTDYLHAIIEAYRRNNNANCTYHSYVPEVDGNACNNCNHENARVNTSKKRRHKYGDVRGIFDSNTPHGGIRGSHYVPF